MNIVTLTSQSQITIPAKVRRTMKLTPGDKLWLSVNDKGQLYGSKITGIAVSRGIFKHYQPTNKSVDKEDVWLERYPRSV